MNTAYNPSPSILPLPTPPPVNLRLIFRIPDIPVSRMSLSLSPLLLRNLRGGTIGGSISLRGTEVGLEDAESSVPDAFALPSFLWFAEACLVNVVLSETVPISVLLLASWALRIALC